jgi:tetratricopeptide (TPR) repeat protein
MNFFKRWFRRKPAPAPSLTTVPTTTPPAPAAPPAPPAQPAPPSDGQIRVFDSYGRELFFTREQWRTRILPDNLKRVWNDPDQLYAFISNAFTDGFIADVVPAARHMYEMEKSSRTVSLMSHILIEQRSFDQAEALCNHFLETFGEDAYVLTSLARIHGARYRENAAINMLWRSLQVDPNQPFAVLWFRDLHAQAGGADAGLNALKRVAALPKSWRAQLWIARTALEAKDLPAALTAYCQALDHAGAPPPAELLEQLTGDLGQHGHIEELLSLATPVFDARLHGIVVGNNMIKAHLDAGQIDEAREILNQLSTIQLPDWKQTLAFWEMEITKARVESTEISPADPMSVTMMYFEGPIWAPPQSPLLELFPGKSESAVRIAFLPASVSAPEDAPRTIKHQVADGRGRLSRALPLLLVEQAHLQTEAAASAIIPWVLKPTKGFILAGGSPSDEDAAAHARQLDPPADYVVVTHMAAPTDAAAVELRMVRTIDAHCLGRFSVTCKFTDPQEGVRKLANLLLALIAEHGLAERSAAPDFYKLPDGEQVNNYLLRLEQLLAIRCAAVDDKDADFLYGTRGIVDGNLQLSLHYPQNPLLRFLLAQTLRSLRHVQPEVVAEFQPKITMLQRQYPLAVPFKGIAQKLFDEALAVQPS